LTVTNIRSQEMIKRLPISSIDNQSVKATD